MAAKEDALALRDAVIKGVVEEVGRLVDKDERLLEAQWGDDFTPLSFAIHLGHADVVRLLLGRGADTEASDHGVPLLYFALAHTQEDCLSLFKAMGIPNLGKEPLREEVVEVLLDGGADASRAGPSGVTPLMLAAIKWETGIVQRVVRSLGRRGLDAQTNNGTTAFLCACTAGHAETARLLLLEGADHTIARDDGVGARGIAESYGHVECVALLEWWEGELERAYVMHKARRGLEVPATWQAPGAPVPAYLRARAQGNKRAPQVHLCGLGRQQEQSGEGPCEAQKDATLKFVMHDLAPELYIELMAGFHK